MEWIKKNVLQIIILIAVGFVALLQFKLLAKLDETKVAVASISNVTELTNSKLDDVESDINSK